MRQGGLELTTARQLWNTKPHIWQLIRHGRYARSDDGAALGLSRHGVLDVVMALANLEKPDLIVTSPAIRAKESAQIVATFFHMDPGGIIAIEGLADVCISPEALKILMRSDKPWAQSWTSGMAGIETIADFIKRRKAAIGSIPRDKKVAWIGHEEDFWLINYLVHGFPMATSILQQIPNGSAMIVDMDEVYVKRALDRLQ